jgi:hypothetical protein
LSCLFRKKRSHQLRYVLRNKGTGQVFLTILFTLYLKEDVNEDGTLKPEASRAYISNVPGTVEDQAVTTTKVDANEPGFDGEAALEQGRRHLRDIDPSARQNPTPIDDIDTVD